MCGKAEELERLALALDEGVKQMEKVGAPRQPKSSDDATGLQKTIQETLEINHMQRRLNTQCLALRLYYRKLLERYSRKVVNCDIPAAVVDAVMSTEADLVEEETDATVVMNRLVMGVMDNVACSAEHPIADEVGTAFRRCGMTIRHRAA